jgi:hypothetical protein
MDVPIDLDQHMHICIDLDLQYTNIKQMLLYLLIIDLECQILKNSLRSRYVIIKAIMLLMCHSTSTHREYNIPT